MDRMGGKQKRTAQPDTEMGIWLLPFSQIRRQEPERQKDHDTGEDVEKNVRDTITHGVQLPEFIINGITEHANGLVSGALLKSKNLNDISPIEASDLWIGIDHRIVPIGKEVAQ